MLFKPQQRGRSFLSQRAVLLGKFLGVHFMILVSSPVTIALATGAANGCGGSGGPIDTCMSGVPDAGGWRPTC